MNPFRRTVTPEPAATAENPPESTTPSTRFNPWRLAAGWASTADIHADEDGRPVRESRYHTWLPVRGRQLRAELADYANAQGWPIDRPAGRLDALEEAAREVLVRFYRVPKPRPEDVNPLGPPPAWARRGDHDALPDPLNAPGSLAEVFIAEAAYTSEGRAVAALFGALHAWNPDSQTWERWGNHSDLGPTIGDFMAGQLYWAGPEGAETLQPCGPVTTAIINGVADLLEVLPNDRWPAGPAEVAAFDHRRATKHPTHTFVQIPGAYSTPSHPGRSIR